MNQLHCNALKVSIVIDSVHSFVVDHPKSTNIHHSKMETKENRQNMDAFVCQAKSLVDTIVALDAENEQLKRDKTSQQKEILPI